MPHPNAKPNRLKKLWGGCVLGIGGLWLIGGLFGILEGQLVAWLFVLCGFMLLRLGYQLVRATPNPPREL